MILKGDTPLHLAILKENFEIINILLNNGAKLDIKNNVQILCLFILDKKINLTKF